MARGSSIEWTKETWNPVRGCTRVSEGCRNCYAEVMAARFSSPGLWGHGFAEIVRDQQGKAVDHRWTGKVALIEEQLYLPLKWREPTTIFANSTSDLFHAGLERHEIAQIWAVMSVAQQHRFQVLTKREARMRELLGDVEFWEEVDAFAEHLAFDQSDPLDRRRDDYRAIAASGLPHRRLPNVWLGVSIEDQATAEQRVPILLQTPAARRFVSAEPLLGPIDLTNLAHDVGMASHIDALAGRARICKPHGYEWTEPGKLTRLDLVITGGESGPEARPMHPDWLRSLRDQCATAGVPFFFKQWGLWAPDPKQDHARGDYVSIVPGAEAMSCADAAFMAPIGKKQAGALLDGREHRDLPQ